MGSISREIKRNTKYGKKYIPCHADKRAKRVGERQRHQAPLKNPFVFLYVREHLRKPYCWSPETIAGRLSIEYPGYTIDDDTIYEYIYGEKQRRMKLWKYLRLHRKRRMKKHGRKVKGSMRIVGAIPTGDHPARITERKEIGHWETDNMEGRRSDTTAISVSAERVTRIIRLRKLKDHKAATKKDVVLDHLTMDKAKGVTINRGTENSDLAKESTIPAYGCQPYHSREKETVENTIGRVKVYMPKGSSVESVTQKQIDGIEEHMNNTPRKILGFLTPNAVMLKIQLSSSIP